MPHENNIDFQNAREKYKDIDIAIAECSKPSTGMGIELGWLFDDKKTIYCLYKKGTMPSGAIEAVASEIIEYENSKDFVIKIKEIITKTAQFTTAE